MATILVELINKQNVMTMRILITIVIIFSRNYLKHSLPGLDFGSRNVTEAGCDSVITSQNFCWILLQLSMCVCISTHVHICVCISIHVCVYSYSHVCIYVCAYLHMHIYVYACVYLLTFF